MGKKIRTLCGLGRYMFQKLPYETWFHKFIYSKLDLLEVLFFADAKSFDLPYLTNLSVLYQMRKTRIYWQPIPCCPATVQVLLVSRSKEYLNYLVLIVGVIDLIGISRVFMDSRSILKV